VLKTVSAAEVKGIRHALPDRLLATSSTFATFTTMVD
jgi:hypothetical protein